MKWSRILVGLLLSLAYLLTSSADTTVKDFTLPSATSNSLIHLSDYGGKVVLINWWRTSCAWSQKESPRLAELYKQYHDKRLVILGVSDDTSDSIGEIPAYLKRYGITWPIGLNDQGEFQRELRPMDMGGTPGNLLVTRSGKLITLGVDRSPETWEKLVAAVKQALDEKVPAVSPVLPRKLEPAPSLVLPDVQGKKVALPQFAGKPLVINFFNSQSCDWTGAVLSKLNQDYAGRGLQVVGIDLYDSDETVKQCTGKYGAKYSVLRGDQPTQMAWIGDSKGWATFFVTSDGKVLKKIVDSIENGIEEPVFTKYAEYIVTKH